MSSKVETKTVDYKSINMDTFESVGLKENLLRGIYGIGWEKPSSIQKQAVPAILTTRDVIMQAQSGQGKTGAFATSVLQNINEEEATIQAIILVHVHELADQISKVTQSLGNYMNINVIKCVGKTHVRDRLMHPGRATILVGTPGKIRTVLEKNLIKSQTYALRNFVIDECDKMLEDNFIDDVQAIFGYINQNTQIVLSSATYNDNVMNISSQFMQDPILITLKEESVSLEGIDQYKITLDLEAHKFDTIMDLYTNPKLVIGQSVIFINSKRKCDYLEDLFNREKFSVRSIHGGMESAQREEAMNDFRKGSVRVLLSTDITGRGIDIPGISLVINYDVPHDVAQYIHRIGRSGRYGKKGFTIAFVCTNRDHETIKEIENHYKITIPDLPMDYDQLIK